MDAAANTRPKRARAAPSHHAEFEVPDNVIGPSRGGGPRPAGPQAPRLSQGTSKNFNQPRQPAPDAQPVSTPVEEAYSVRR